MTNRMCRVAAAVLGVAAAAATATIAIGSGSASAAVPAGCVEQRQLTSATVRCPGTSGWFAEVEVDCTGLYLTYGLSPGVGRYTQLAFGDISRGVTVGCVGGYPNQGLGIVSDIRVRVV